MTKKTKEIKFGRREKQAHELRVAVLRLYDKGQGMKKAAIARELEVSRERVGQIIKEAGLQ